MWWFTRQTHSFYTQKIERTNDLDRESVGLGTHDVFGWQPTVSNTPFQRFSLQPTRKITMLMIKRFNKTKFLLEKLNLPKYIGFTTRLRCSCRVHCSCSYEFELSPSSKKTLLWNWLSSVPNFIITYSRIESRFL